MMQKKKNTNKKRFEAGRIFNDLTIKVKFPTNYLMVNMAYVQKFDRIVCLMRNDDT